MIFLNNKLVPENKALISVFDHGFLYGDGIYETIRLYKGVAFKIDEHIERLYRSASLIKLSVPLSHGRIKNAVYRTVEANRLKDAVVRITVSRGAGPTGLDPQLCKKPTFVIMAKEFKKYPRSYYQKGVKVTVVNTRRNFRGAIDPQIKSLNFLNNVLAKIEAKESGAYEALMLNHRGYLTEGTVCNLFFVRDCTLYSPSLDTGILDGITRRIILKCAEELSVPIKEGRYRKTALYKADEIFLSNTTMEVMPVSEVDLVKIEAPGEISKLLLGAYREKVSEYIKSG